MANNCCQCKGRRNVQIIGEWEHCPLQDGYHTAFTIYRCNSCGLLRGFPHENLQIAMDRGTDETKHILADYIKKR